MKIVIKTPHRIGVMGYSGQKFDIVKAKRLLYPVLDKYLKENPNIEIVSGYTNIGIPALAYRWAKLNGVTTVGIACAKAKEYEVFPCDKVKIVGKEWGDESNTFLEYCTSFVKVGGGAQSIAEAAKARSMKKVVIELELPTI